MSDFVKCINCGEFFRRAAKALELLGLKDNDTTREHCAECLVHYLQADPASLGPSQRKARAERA